MMGFAYVSPDNLLECEGGPAYRRRKHIIYPDVPPHRRKTPPPHHRPLRLIAGGDEWGYTPRPSLRLVDPPSPVVDMMPEIDSLLAKCRQLKQLRNGQNLQPELSRVESVRRFLKKWTKETHPAHRDQLQLTQEQ